MVKAKDMQNSVSVSVIAAHLSEVSTDKKSNEKALLLGREVVKLFQEGHKAGILGTSGIIFTLVTAHNESTFKLVNGSYSVNLKNLYAQKAEKSEDKKIREAAISRILIDVFGFKHSTKEDGKEDLNAVDPDEYVPAGLRRGILQSLPSVAYIISEQEKEALKPAASLVEDAAMKKLIQPIVSLVTIDDITAIKAEILPDKSNIKEVLRRVELTPLGGLKVRVSVIACRKIRDKEGRLSSDLTKAAASCIAWHQSSNKYSLVTRSIVIGSSKVRGIDAHFATIDELQEVSRQRLHINNSKRQPRTATNERNSALAGADMASLVGALAAKANAASVISDATQTAITDNLVLLSNASHMPVLFAVKRFLAQWDSNGDAMDNDTLTLLTDIREEIDTLLTEQAPKALKVASKVKQLATASRA